MPPADPPQAPAWQAHAPSAAEFDAVAGDYQRQHRASIALSGEAPDYFAAQKPRDLAALARRRGFAPRRILDFGCGVGNSVPHLRACFAGAALTCADTSSRSMALAQQRFPGDERYAQVGDTLPLPDASVDLAFSACVFHHIPPAQHAHWLAELRRVTRPGGWLAIYEHNPWNPLTRHAVRRCPFDRGAVLVSGPQLRARAARAGWQPLDLGYTVFFPAALAALRPLEPSLAWLPMGAQYRMVAQRNETQ